ncbi:hypothetical protein ACFLZ5_04120 [Thermodesulfobacteriota bacterium]
MIDQMILMIAQGKVGWVLMGALGTVAMVFAVYYVSFALYLIFASLYSGYKLIPESYRIWREDLAATYDTSWGNAQLGVTMPDGGEPVEEKEEKEEKEEEA